MHALVRRPEPEILETHKRKLVPTTRRVTKRDCTRHASRSSLAGGLSQVVSLSTATRVACVTLIPHGRVGVNQGNDDLTSLALRLELT